MNKQQLTFSLTLQIWFSFAEALTKSVASTHSVHLASLDGFNIKDHASMLMSQAAGTDLFTVLVYITQAVFPLILLFTGLF